MSPNVQCGSWACKHLLWFFFSQHSCSVHKSCCGTTQHCSTHTIILNVRKPGCRMKLMFIASENWITQKEPDTDARLFMLCHLIQTAAVKQVRLPLRPGSAASGERLLAARWKRQHARPLEREVCRKMRLRRVGWMRPAEATADSHFISTLTAGSDEWAAQRAANVGATNQCSRPGGVGGGGSFCLRSRKPDKEKKKRNCIKSLGWIHLEKNLKKAKLWRW